MPSARRSSHLALSAWTALFFLAGLPVASRLPPTAPGWAVFALAGWGLVHAAVLSGLTLVIGMLVPEGRKGRLPILTAVGVLAVAFVAVDALLYSLQGLHLHWSALRVLGQPGALVTLGVRPGELSLGGLALGVIAVGGALASRRPLARGPVARWLGVALALDVGCALASTVTRFYGAAPHGLAEALPLAWVPPGDAVLTRLTGRTPAPSADEAFQPGSFEPLRVPLAAAPAPTLARQPDLLLVVIESLRASDLEAMPNLRALALRSVVGERHYSSGNCTLTGTFSLYTGLSPMFSTVEETWRSAAGLQAFAAAGYEVSLTHSASLVLGLPERVLERPMDHVIGKPERSLQALDDANLALAQQWLSRPRGRPGFLVLFLDSTHWPYSLDDEAATAEPSWLLRHDPDELHQRYLAAVHRQDERLGALMKALEQAGRTDEVAVVVTGDHGEAFGEQGLLLHGSRLDEAQTRVPLVMHLPGVEPRHLDAPTVHQDVLPTLLGYLGAHPMPARGGGGIDVLAAGPREVAPVVGYCGFGDPLGYALILPDRKVFFTVNGGHAQFKSQRTLDDAPFEDQRPDDETRRALERVSAGFHALLGAPQ